MPSSGLLSLNLAWQVNAVPKGAAVRTLLDKTRNGMSVRMCFVVLMGLLWCVVDPRIGAIARIDRRWQKQGGRIIVGRIMRTAPVID